jgi:hypothetical protein
VGCVVEIGGGRSDSQLVYCLCVLIDRLTKHVNSILQNDAGVDSAEMLGQQMFGVELWGKQVKGENRGRVF